MKVKITPAKKYMLEVDKHPIGEFSLISTWEGFSLFRNSKGESVIVNGVDTALDNIFRSIFNSTEEHDGEVMRISLDLIPVKKEE